MNRSLFTSFAATLLAATFFLSGCATNPTSNQQGTRTAYHVNTGVDTAAAALNNVRNHLNAEPKAKIIVVTHGPGIDFLLQNAKDGQGRVFSGTVSELSALGVEFRVCNNTLVSRKIDAGNLLMETKVVPSGVAEVARLQFSEGYAYLKP